MDRAIIGIEIDISGVYIVGNVDVRPLTGQWFVEKRSKNRGSSVWTDKLEMTYGGGNPQDIVINENGAIYVAGHNTIFDTKLKYSKTGWRVEKR